MDRIKEVRYPLPSIPDDCPTISFGGAKKCPNPPAAILTTRITKHKNRKVPVLTVAVSFTS